MKGRYVSGWLGEKEAGKGGNMGAARKRERGHNVGRRIQGKIRCPYKCLLVTHNATGPDPKAGTKQLSHSFPRKRLLEEERRES